MEKMGPKCDAHAFVVHCLATNPGPQYQGLLTVLSQSIKTSEYLRGRAIATFLATWRYCPQHGRMSGILPSIRKVATVRLYTAVPFPMEPGMQSETLKKARAATFLNRSALCLLMFPVACLIWALNAYPPQDACWLCFSLAIYTWPFAGVLFVISAGFHAGSRGRRLKKDIGFQEAHGH